MGVISAIGNNLAENHRSLIEGRCGVAFSSSLPTRYAGERPFGQVPITTSELKKALHLTDPGLTRTTLLALHALQDALKDAHLSPADIRAADTALVGASTVGGMCLTDELYRDTNGDAEGSPYLGSYDCASVFQYLQSHLSLTGLVTTINTACSSSANAIQYGARLIRHGLARKAIVGGVDSLAKYTINGFNALQILSPGVCRPFDSDRQGLNLGEGAAFLILEKEEDIKGKRVYAELTGYCNVNDAFHPSSLSAEGDGPYLAMAGALKEAGLNAGDIGYINAHGTGTENNDAAESMAMIRVFQTPPPFASSKSNIGHTLGASGAIEAVYSILSLVHQEIYASLSFSKPIPETGLQPVDAYAKKPLQHVLSNSFGFGGNCTSLIFSKAH
jgi:3-oxoacyl-(acyl-carrier-protein) synthase